MQEEFFWVAFRKKIYESIDQLQTDLDQWIDYYNNQRTHSGKFCFGKTPIQTFKDSIRIAREKLINQEQLIFSDQSSLNKKREVDQEKSLNLTNNMGHQQDVR